MGRDPMFQVSERGKSLFRYAARSVEKQLEDNMSIIKRKGNIALDEGFSSRPCRILYGYHDVNDTDNDSGETFWYETEKY